MSRYAEDGFDRLIEAMIIQAAQDFRLVFRRRLRGKPVTGKMEKRFNEAEEFLESPQYEAYSNLESDYLINKIMETERRKYRNELERRS